jgi:hypothetical protein
MKAMRNSARAANRCRMNGSPECIGGAAAMRLRNPFARLKTVADTSKRCDRLTFGCRRTTVSGHKFKIGQLVYYLGREGASSLYQVTQLLPPEGEAFQYHIKNANEPHERMAKEHELFSAA